MREKIFSIFFFSLLLAMLYWGARLFEPFIGPLVCAIAVAIVFYPMHLKLRRWMPKRSVSFQALLSDFAVFLFLIIPAGLILWAIASEFDAVASVIKQGLDAVKGWIANPVASFPWIAKLPPAITRQFDYRSTHVQQQIADLANRAVGVLAPLGTALAGHTLIFIIDVLIFLFILFFIFRDGEALLEHIDRLLPLDAASKERINVKLRLTVVGVVRGSFLIALIQGATATVGFLLVGAKAAFVLGFLTALATFIPGVGSATVLLPVTLFYLFTGSYLRAAFLFAWAVLLVGLVDNLLRPYVVGSKADMPFFWLFFSLLGGIEVFGPLGILLGPLIVSLVPILLDIYEQRYLNRRNAGAERTAPGGR